MTTLAKKLLSAFAATTLVVSGAAQAKVMAMQACLNEIVQVYHGDNGCNAHQWSGSSGPTTINCTDGAVVQVYEIQFSGGAWHCNSYPVMSL